MLIYHANLALYFIVLMRGMFGQVAAIHDAHNLSACRVIFFCLASVKFCNFFYKQKAELMTISLCASLLNLFSCRFPAGRNHHC